MFRKEENGVVLDADLPDEDIGWCSEESKKAVLAQVLKYYPCPQKIEKIDLIPLFAKGRKRHYRLSLWVKNCFESNYIVKSLSLWKSLYIVSEGAARTVISIDNKKVSETKQAPESKYINSVQKECVGISGAGKGSF